MRNVLIVEDDVDIMELISIHLLDLGCRLWKESNGIKGFELALGNSFDLIILDLTLPDMDGLEICRKVRAKDISTPILMITARSEEIDKVLGLEMGADDYLTKPFSIREFIARAKAIFRRSEMQVDSNLKKSFSGSILIENLHIDINMRKVTLNGIRIDLTPKEHDLLLLMATHPGRSYTREELLNTVWGYEFSGYEHTVNSHINRLRSKIEADFTKPRYILTTWGIGYRFNDEITIKNKPSE